MINRDFSHSGNSQNQVPGKSDKMHNLVAAKINRFQYLSIYCILNAICEKLKNQNKN